MQRFIKKVYLPICLALALSSCGPHEFGTKSSKILETTSSKQSYSSGEICSQSSIIKPHVDFLFLWDNSSSQTYVDPALKSALNNTINKISEQFDYHILMAPLNKLGADMTSTYFASFDTTGLTSNALSIKIPYTSAASKLDEIIRSTAGGSQERGFQRAIDLINANRSNGIFRQNAYTNIILMSNGDVRIFDGGHWIPYLTNQHIMTKKIQLLNLRNSLQSEQMRFISLVSHIDESSPTNPYGYKKGYAYIEMSKLIYQDIGHKIKPDDQNARSTPDSYNVAGVDYLHVFDGINSSIQQVVIAHKYDYWPVTIPTPFDQNTLKVTKYSGTIATELAAGDNVNGFTYEAWKSNKNTRYEPTPGEPYTGYMIRLHGTARVTFPECVVVEGISPDEYWGYYSLPNNPLVSSIIFKVNGRTIPQCSATPYNNCWDYIGLRSSFNVKVLSPSEPDQPGTPAELRTGYMLKLYGDSIYTNDDTIFSSYDPSTAP